MAETPTLRDAIRSCEEIAAGNNSTLFHAARLLPRYRRDLFSVTYAAMRVIDDRVDEGFLTLPENEREARRALVSGEVETWRLETAEQSATGALPATVSTAFSGLVASSDLGPRPWNGLAAALQEDVAEREMAEWRDFDAYAEGATVAPAEIFIYLLACKETNSGFRHGLPRAPKHYARDLGMFCYLVHILRDLAKDAGALGKAMAPRLITIPTSVLAAIGLKRDELGDVARDQTDDRLDRLAGQILSRAEGWRQAGRARLAELTPMLGPRERAAIEGLVQVYEKLHRDFKRDYGRRLRDLPGLEDGVRRAIFGT